MEISSKQSPQPCSVVIRVLSEALIQRLTRESSQLCDVTIVLLETSQRLFRRAETVVRETRAGKVSSTVGEKTK